MSDTKRTYGVVGAGPAGLAAAWRLARTGARVRVYEARSEAGGRLRTESLSGTAADAVVQLLSADYRSLNAMLADLGLSDRLVGVPGEDALWRNGRAHPVRYGSLGRMAISAALPAGLKVRLALRYAPFLERHGPALDLNDPTRAAAAGLDGESIAQWGSREMGDEFVELLVYPLLASYYGVAPEETSAALFHGLARAGMGVKVTGIRGGAGPLAAEIAARLATRGVEVLAGDAVARVEASEVSARVTTVTGATEHDGVVVAVPCAAGRELAPSLPWPTWARSRSTATLVLALREPLSTGWFGLSIPRIEPPGETLAAICIQEEKRTGVAPPGTGSLVVVPAPPAGERWCVAEAGAVLEEALPALEQVLPGVRSRITEARLVRLPDSTFVPVPGHFDRLRSMDPDAWPPRLAPAGDYLVAPTVEGAVRSGIRAAERISRDAT